MARSSPPDSECSPWHLGTELVNTTGFFASLGGGDKTILSHWLVWEILGVLLGGLISGLLAKRAAPDARPTLLSGAMGDRHPASYPSSVGLPTFIPKVKLAGAGGKKSAGCGG